MTDTITLKGEQWKQLALLSYVQLQRFLNDIPGVTESGEAALTDQHLALIDEHLAEARLFLRSWRAAKMPEPPQKAEARPTNGAEPVKKRRGRPPKPKTEAQAVQ